MAQFEYTGSPIRLPHGVIVRAPGLLPMDYTVGELAQVIGIPDRTLRDWLSAGAPHFRAGGSLWVEGHSFSAWVALQRKEKREARLSPEEAYCFRCRSVRRMVNVTRKPVRGRLVHIIGTCPECGSTIQRGDRDA